MKRKIIYRLIMEQKDEWNEFARIIGLKNTAQQLAVGFAIGGILLFILGGAEYIHDLIFSGV